MYTIENNLISELIIKNSKFICILNKIDSIENVENILNNIKISNPDATHYCYAYIINNITKSSDDGEPSGTAGIPILKVLENNHLTNVIAIVIRYFGGIKLGANGLIRAYTKITANTIKLTNLNELIEGLNLDITFEYSKVKEIDYLLKDIKINKKTYNTNITYNLNIPITFLEILKLNNIKYNHIKNILIEKSIK